MTTAASSDKSIYTNIVGDCTECSGKVTEYERRFFANDDGLFCSPDCRDEWGMKQLDASRCECGLVKADGVCVKCGETMPAPLFADQPIGITDSHVVDELPAEVVADEARAKSMSAKSMEEQMLQLASELPGSRGQEARDTLARREEERVALVAMDKAIEEFDDTDPHADAKMRAKLEVHREVLERIEARLEEERHQGFAPGDDGVYEVGYRLGTTAAVLIDACPCGRERKSIAEGVIRLAEHDKSLPVAQCSCGRLVRGVNKLIKTAGSKIVLPH